MTYIDTFPHPLEEDADYADYFDDPFNDPHDCERCGRITTALSNYCNKCSDELDRIEDTEQEEFKFLAMRQIDDIEAVLSDGKRLPSGWLHSIDTHL